MSVGTFLNGGTVTQLRGLAFLSLSETGSLLHRSGTTDSGGGATITWGTSGTFPCRVDPLTGSESVVADRTADRSTHKITTLPQTPVTHNDRWKIGTQTYEVTALRDRTAEWLRVFEAVKLDT